MVSAADALKLQGYCQHVREIHISTS